ncbi:MAG: hypothetical protein NC205_06895 [Prevotella sp.]|nr:hypothetical protein [Alistipes senegalensis]MCM1358306.1 hypothetical protein [Prevotella sp.]
MGNVDLYFIRDLVIEITDFMKETIIFEPYIPFFYNSVTLFDIFVGLFTLSTVLAIFGFNDD